MDSRAEHHDGDAIRISKGVLYFALFGAGAAWFLQLIIKYAVNSHSCYPGFLPSSSTAPANLAWLWPVMVTVDVVALAIALTAGILAYRDWKAILSEEGLAPTAPTDALERPARFFALWGMLFAFGFSAAILFDLINVLVLNRCG